MEGWLGRERIDSHLPGVLSKCGFFFFFFQGVGVKGFIFRRFPLGFYLFALMSAQDCSLTAKRQQSTGKNEGGKQWRLFETVQ